MTSNSPFEFFSVSRTCKEVVSTGFVNIHSSNFMLTSFFGLGILGLKGGFFSLM